MGRDPGAHQRALTRPRAGFLPGSLTNAAWRLPARFRTRRRCSPRTRATPQAMALSAATVFILGAVVAGVGPSAEEWRSGAVLHTLRQHDDVRQSHPGLPAGQRTLPGRYYNAARDLGRGAGAHLRAALGSAWAAPPSSPSRGITRPRAWAARASSWYAVRRRGARLL